MKVFSSRRWWPLICGFSLFACTPPADFSRTQHTVSTYLAPQAGALRETLTDRALAQAIQHRSGDHVTANSVYVPDAQLAWRGLVGRRSVTP